jgi:hypothetical protein
VAGNIGDDNSVDPFLNVEHIVIITADRFGGEVTGADLEVVRVIEIAESSPC